MVEFQASGSAASGVRQPVRFTDAKKTLLWTLYFRYRDARSRRPIVGDPWAAPIFDRVDVPRWKLWLRSSDRFLGLLRTRRIDAWVREALEANPDLTVLHLACGLDSRAFRLELPESVRWYDVDFPEVIALRRRLYPEHPSAGYHLIGSSVTDTAWLEEIPADRPVLIIAEGLLMYLPEEDGWALLRRLLGRFSGGELVFDIVSPTAAKASDLFGWTPRGAREVMERNEELELVDDVATVDDHAFVGSAGYRWIYRLVATSRKGRDLVRVFRFRF